MNAIVYTSNTGYTFAYAKMLGEKLGVPVYNIKDARKMLPDDMEIIYMGWLFASDIKDYKKAAKRHKIKAVCGVGLGDTGSQIEEVRKKAGIPDDIPLFTLQGGMDFDKLRGINKFMIKMLIKVLDKKEKTEDEEKMLQLIKTGGSYVKEENLRDFISWYDNIPQE